MSKIAIITGGARGISLAVAKALAATGSWTFHIVDLDEAAGQSAAGELGNSSQCYIGDVTSYTTMAALFDTIFKRAQRLDLVFCGAGILEHNDFYDDHPPADGPPPELDQRTIDVNYKGTVIVSYLAQHYFRQNPPEVVDTNLVLMASCTGFYPVPGFPLYVSSKHAVLGFGRSISKVCYSRSKTRVNALCPGFVATDLFSQDQVDTSAFPPHWWTSIHAVTQAAVMLINGTDVVDSRGKTLPLEKAWGLAIEVSGENNYFRDWLEYGDELMAEVMEGVSVGFT